MPNVLYCRVNILCLIFYLLCEDKKCICLAHHVISPAHVCSVAKTEYLLWLRQCSKPFLGIKSFKLIIKPSGVTIDNPVF